MTTWKQERPTWCPHADCQFLARTQDAVCIGKLAQPSDHAGTPNTHRLCQRGAEDDGSWLHTVAWNRGDAWNMRRVIDAAFKFGPQ